MNNYYTVFDLSPEDGSRSVGIARKNPIFVPDSEDTGGGSIPEVIKKNVGAVVVVVFIVALCCLSGVLLCKRK